MAEWGGASGWFFRFAVPLTFSGWAFTGVFSFCSVWLGVNGSMFCFYAVSVFFFLICDVRLFLLGKL